LGAIRAKQQPCFFIVSGLIENRSVRTKHAGAAPRNRNVQLRFEANHVCQNEPAARAGRGALQTLQFLRTLKMRDAAAQTLQFLGALKTKAAAAAAQPVAQSSAFPCPAAPSRSFPYRPNSPGGAPFT
jgi:hypothetical protein